MATSTSGIARAFADIDSGNGGAVADNGKADGAGGSQMASTAHVFGTPVNVSLPDDGDVNGDADFAIRLTGAHSLAAGRFIL